jgi:alkanesulfonate monooxygenase SsuD/methylene tetrahydromethanopterin reductase-like flavin-dependent oxidoreductase (luciferase family)
VASLRDRARPGLALYFGGMGARGQNFYNDVLRRYGYEQVAEQIQDAYLGGDREAAAAMVPAELVEGMSLVGDAGFVKDRVAAYREAGVTVLNVQPIGPNGIHDVETVASWIT